MSKRKPMATLVKPTQLGLSFSLPGATATSLTLPAKLPWETWVRTAKAVRMVATAARWWIGDLLAHGEGTYGEKYSQMLDQSGYTYEDVARMIRVAKRVAPSVRRADLSWSHHAVVATMDEPEQRTWLEDAAKHGWSVATLSDMIHGREPEAGGGGRGSAKEPCECCQQGACSIEDCRCKQAPLTTVRGSANVTRSGVSA